MAEKKTTAFHEIVSAKGWTLKEVGIRWGGLSERQMSRVAKAAKQRDLDAAKGLPEKLKVKNTQGMDG